MQKNVKKHISTSMWREQHPKAGQNIPHMLFFSKTAHAYSFVETKIHLFISRNKKEVICLRQKVWQKKSKKDKRKKKATQPLNDTTWFYTGFSFKFSFSLKSHLLSIQ